MTSVCMFNQPHRVLFKDALSTQLWALWQLAFLSRAGGWEPASTNQSVATTNDWPQYAASCHILPKLAAITKSWSNAPPKLLACLRFLRRPILCTTFMEGCTQNWPSPKVQTRSGYWSSLINSLDYVHETWHTCSLCSWLWCKPARLTTFFKLAPFRSPLTDLIDFGIAGKLLTSATRRCSPFVDSLSRIWIKPKTTDCLLQLGSRLQLFNQSTPSRVQLTAGSNDHNRHFDRPSLVSSVLRRVCARKIDLYVSWAAYFRGVLPWLQRPTVKPAGFACMGTISRVIVKVTSSNDQEKIRVRSKSTARQAGRFQRRGLLRTLNKQFWACSFKFCSVTSLQMYFIYDDNWQHWQLNLEILQKFSQK